MKKLYAPWRDSYTRSSGALKRADATREECPFCIQIQETKDEEHYIIKRFTHVFVIMNKYPYNAGHIMVLPYMHTGSLTKLDKECLHEYMDVLALSEAVLTLAFKSEGINIGTNIGKAAGAGIPSHIHTHLVPRWHGDTNFLAVTADVKVISIDLRTAYQQLVTLFSNL